MCTVSFLPAGDGFHLAMNRDEQLSRMAALPPEVLERGTLRALYPRERSGGTWIGVNEAAVALALINWYSQPQQTTANRRSRGEVIPALLPAATIADAGARLSGLPLNAMNPFRLIAASHRERMLEEWRWNGRALERNPLPWQRRHWFSSGFDEAEANRQRRMAVAREMKLRVPDSVASLRELHRSHHPSKGAFSICMHRVDACTVSFTEVAVRATSAAMIYVAGPACERGPRYAKRLRLRAKDFQPVA